LTRGVAQGPVGYLLGDDPDEEHPLRDAALEAEPLPTLRRLLEGCGDRFGLLRRPARPPAEELEAYQQALRRLGLLTVGE